MNWRPVSKRAAAITLAVLLCLAASLGVISLVMHVLSPRAAIDLYTTSLTLAGAARKDPGQSIDLESALLAHATRAEIADQVVWSGPSPPARSPSAVPVGLSLRGPDVACRRLSIAIAAGTNQSAAESTPLQLRIEPLPPFGNDAETCKGPTWTLLVGGIAPASHPITSALVITLQPLKDPVAVLSNIQTNELLTTVLHRPEVVGAPAPEIAANSNVQASASRIKTIHLAYLPGTKQPALKTQLRTESMADFGAEGDERVGSVLPALGLSGWVLLINVVLAVFNLVVQLSRDANKDEDAAKAKTAKETEAAA